MTERILVIGALGQLGSELVVSLRDIFGSDNVIASDVRTPESSFSDGPMEIVDALNPERIVQVVDQYKVNQIYHLAAMLSAKGEAKPMLAWNLNMQSLLNVLQIAKEKQIQKVYWPSSIACFGPGTPVENTPQHTIMDPNTVYGISKLAGERWCEYYFNKYGIDVRSLRYPGLAGYKTLPGGGTTDYAVDIFHYAIRGENYECFLQPDAMLPMMYMDDAVRGTIELMQAPAASVKIRSSYNIAAMSFTPSQIAEAIKLELPAFTINYKPDFRQKIAESWPDSIDDSAARDDWGWDHRFDLEAMTKDMLANLSITGPQNT